MSSMESLGPGEGGLREGHGVVDRKETWPGLMALSSHLFVELPGIKPPAEDGADLRKR